MASPETERKGGAGTSGDGMPAWLEIMVPAVMLVLTLIYMWDLADIARPEQNLLLLRPLLIVFLVLLACIGWVFVLPAIRRGRAGPNPDPTSVSGSLAERVDAALSRRTPILMVLLVLYASTVFTTNYIASTVIFVAFTSWMMGERGKVSIPLLSILTAVFLFLAATEVLNIRM